MKKQCFEKLKRHETVLGLTAALETAQKKNSRFSRDAVVREFSPIIELFSLVE